MKGTIDVNTDGVNARLLDAKLSAEDREFIHSQIQKYANTRVYVRVVDSERIRRLLKIPQSIDRAATPQLARAGK